MTGSRKGTDLILSNSVAVVTTNTIAIDVVALSSPNPRRSILTWSGIKVRPTAVAPLATGAITRSGTAVYGVTGSNTSYGTLVEVAGATTQLVVTLPGQTFTPNVGVTGTPVAQTAGVPFALTGLIAADSFLNVLTNYNGNKLIDYTGPGGSPTFTTNVTFDAGRATTTLTTVLRKAETTTLTASDGLTIGPASDLLTVERGAFSRLQVLTPGETDAPGTLAGKEGMPETQMAGCAFTVTVFAVDENWNPVETATDTVAITSSDAYASLPASAALSDGTASFVVVPRTAGAQTLAASDITIPAIAEGTSSVVTVTPAELAGLRLLVPGETAAPDASDGKTGLPLAQVAGVAFTVTVHAVDAFWNTVPVTDFVNIDSSDANASLPAPAGLVDGVRSFDVTLNTRGVATLTVDDLSHVELSSRTSSPITVAAGPFTRLQVLVPGETAAAGSPAGKTGAPWPHGVGLPFVVSVNAVDDHWNLVTAVTDTVQFASDDGLAILPGNAALVGGTRTFDVTLGTVGTRTLTVSDVTDGTRLPGTSSAIRVGMADASPATGGESLSADTAGGVYTGLNGPVIREGIPGNIGTGTIVLAMPAGFVINTGSTVRVDVTGIGVGDDVVLASPVVTVGRTALTVEIVTPSTGDRVSTLTWSGIQVRPAAGTPLAGGHILNSGTAVLSGIPAGSDFGTLAVTAGTAARLALQVQPSALATAGTAFARQPVVRVEDQFGNLRATDSATVVTAARGAGAGVLQGTLSAIAVDGVASFVDLYHRLAGSITLQFSAAGLAGIASDGVVVSPAAASRLVFAQPPTGAAAGSTITPAVSLQVRDDFGNDVAEAGIPVSLGLSTGTGSLNGTTSRVTDVSGRATFNDLSLDRAGAKVVTAAAAGLAPADSAVFTIVPAAASRLAFVQPPTDAEAGVGMSPAVAVQVQDGYGNAVTQAGVSIALQLATGTGILEGILTRPTGSNGIAGFPDVSIAAAGVKTLTALSTGLSSVVSSPFTIRPGAYTRVQLLVPGETAAPGTTAGKTGAPETQAAGSAFTVRVNAVDAFWNVIGTVSNAAHVYSNDTGVNVSPASGALEAGTRVFTVTINTAGTHTLIAEDAVDEAVADDTSPAITVVTTYFNLQIVTEHGTAFPGAGLHLQPRGIVLTNSVTGYEIQGSTQYACLGWTLTGNDASGGTATSLVMTVTNDAVLTWRWGTNYWLTVTNHGAGRVMPPSGWYGSGLATNLLAQPDRYHHFVNWSGTAVSTNNPLAASMDRPEYFDATFAENVTAHETPEVWLAQYGWTNDFEAADTGDADGDGLLTWQERIAGTDPTNRFSSLAVAAVTLPDAFHVVLAWPSVSNRLYRVDRFTNLVSSVPEPVGIPTVATPPQNVATDTVGILKGVFYRVHVE